MTREQHFKLKKYESIFRTAIDAQYYRAMTSAFAKDLIDTCKELNIYINVNCGQCMIKAIQTLGKLYFAYNEEPEIEFPQEPLKEDSKTTKEVKKASQNEKKGTYKKKSK